MAINPFSIRTSFERAKAKGLIKESKDKESGQLSDEDVITGAFVNLENTLSSLNLSGPRTRAAARALMHSYQTIIRSLRRDKKVQE